MKSRIKTLAASVLLAGAAVAGQASAASIDYNGAVFDLSLGAGSGDSWEVIYSADFSGYTPGDDMITHIAWKIPSADIDSVSPITQAHVLKSDGCQTNGGSSAWVCLDINPDVATSGSYHWVFDVVFDGDLDMAAFLDEGYSLKARFLGADGGFRGLMSCRIEDDDGVAEVDGDGCSEHQPPSEVPVPGTLGLLGLGLSGLGLVRRRKDA